MKAGSRGASLRPGVIIMNMGGPGTREELEPYLRQLLGDPRIMRFPGGFLIRPLLSRLIARRRSPRVWPRYEAIGGSSPLLAHTRTQAAALEARLGVPVAVAMRYVPPTSAQALAELEARGVNQIVALPMYPQYSTSTSASSFDDLRKALGKKLPVVEISDHFSNPGYLKAMAAGLTDALDRARGNIHVMFTAHSIPESFTAAGDPYVQQIRSTMELIVARTGLTQPFSLAFQSDVPVGTWHGPSLNQALEALKNVDTLVIQPLSFVCENLETLYDLDIVFKEQCLAAGISQVLRVPAPGAHEEYMNGLAAAVREALAGQPEEGLR